MHTSRLKRKLADMGVDASSSRANESFCLIGTPLPPLEKSRDTGEFVPLWKQEVRDEKGRRRLHGAFTGGFSAGYFNTVGSKEGWTPSTFVSSRSDRAKGKQKQARPEDFMDEEDLAELAADRKLVDTTEELNLGPADTVAGVGDPENDSMAAKLEQALLPAVSDSPGARILRKMGWRPGQGIGPRLTLAQKRTQDRQLGLAETDVNEMEVDDGGEAAKHTYAPRDTPVVTSVRKADAHGLGYHPGLGLHQQMGNASDAQAGPNLSAGFGLGALNDADDDDVDIYDSGVSRGKTRMAFDIVDDDDNEEIAMGGSSGHRTKTSRSKPKVARPAPSVGGTFRDGRPVLSGFVVAEQPVTEDTWYPLPEVPKGWKPNPRRIWDSDKENSVRPLPPVQAVKGHHEWKKGISADERGSILGETPLPAAPRSVFDFMSQKDRERLQRAAGSLASGDAAASSAGPVPAASMPPPAPETIHIPPTPPPTAKAALLGFQPFISNPATHARYTTYLRSQSAADGSAPALALAPGQTIAAFNREAAEFAQAAAVFKPLSGAMAGRFTTAAIVESTANAQGGLYTPSFDKEEPKAEEVQKEEEKEEDPKTHAARMGMFGPLTRTAVRWAPVKLLCKRFGVKDPHPEADAAPETAAFPSAAAGSSSAGTDAAPIPEEQLAIEGPPTHASDYAKPSGPRDLANIGLGEDAYQAQEVLTYERPERDVFKAIFASDDEDSDEEEPAEEPDADVPVPAPTQSVGAVTPAAAPSALLPAAPASVSTAVVSALPAAGSEKLDLSTFKPTFVPRVERDARKTEGKVPAKDKERKKKNDKTLVSFDTEDGEDIALGAPRPKKRKDKGKEREKDVEKGREKKKRRKEGEPVDQEEWVEKAPSEAVKQMQVAGSIPSAIPTASTRSEAVTKGRMKAADFT